MAMATELREIIPWQLYPVKKTIQSEEDLVFLGKGNLKFLLTYHHNAVETHALAINDMTERVGLLRRILNGEFDQLVAEYDHPNTIKMEVFGSFEGDFWAPAKEEILKRSAGSTSFNICGWCNHCEGVGQRGSCHLDGYCGFVHRGISGRWPNDGKLSFMTPCVLASLTTEQLKQCQEDLIRKIDVYQGIHERLMGVTSYLSALIERAEEKPCFPCARPAQWMEVGAEIKFYDSLGAGLIKPRRFDSGQIVACVEDEVAKLQLDGLGARDYIRTRPELLKNWEYEYLRENPEYLKLWLKGVNNSNFSEYGFRRALRAS